MASAMTTLKHPEEFDATIEGFVIVGEVSDEDEGEAEG
jgi:hypothetical protein